MSKRRDRSEDRIEYQSEAKGLALKLDVMGEASFRLRSGTRIVVAQCDQATRLSIMRRLQGEILEEK